MTHANSYPKNSVSSPQRMLKALGRLQTSAVSTILGSVYIYDLVEQRTLSASYPIAAMLGYTADTIHLMGPVGLANLIHPSDLERVSEHYQQFTTLRCDEVISIEYRMRRADGTWCWLRSQETPLTEAIDGLPLQILGMLQDLTPLSTRSFSKTILSAKSFRRYRLVQRGRTVQNRRKQRILSRINHPKPTF